MNPEYMYYIYDIKYTESENYRYILYIDIAWQCLIIYIYIIFHMRCQENTGVLYGENVLNTNKS